MIRIALAAIVASFMLFGGSARAEYSLCNLTSYAMSAVIGYVNEGVVETRGWWGLKPGQCRIVLTEKIQAGDYYVFAEAIRGHRGRRRIWSGDAPLCVADSGFFTLPNQGPCEGQGLSLRSFARIEVAEDAGGQWRTDFTDAEDYSSIDRAETAGVQRLLSDIGYDIGGIDGYMGQKTRDAIADFKRRHGLSDPAVIDDDFIDALISTANERESALGLTFCNDSSSAVWTALGKSARDGQASARGWWLLAPNSCAKVEKGELSASEFYVYAVTDDGERPLSRGQRAFCVNSVMFEIPANVVCEDEGYESAQFRRIDTGGGGAFTLRLTADDFSGP